MSDFFMPTQNNVDQEAEKYRNAVNSVQNQEIEEYKQKKQQHLKNWDRYGVNVPDEYYEAFNKIIAQAPTPEEAQEEAYKIGSAVKYSEAMGIPLLEAYQNVDAFNEAQFTDLQGQKGRFEALSDMLNLGRNNVKLGRLGQELMQAHINNDTELANSLMAEIDAINQQNQLMQDNAPRSWVMQALEAGAQSLPFTGVVAGAGIVGNFIAPAAGTAAAFTASSYLSAGTEYIDMIANGASPETARLVATVSGGIQGLIEADLGISKSIVKSTARVIGKKAAENAAKKSVEEIGRKVFKRFHFGAGKKVLINYLENRGKDILGEGTEEFLQEITSIVGQEVAAGLDGYDIPDDDFKSIVKQTTEAFRGGVLGALSMGFIPAGINAAADVREYKLIKDTAEVFESEEMFKNAAKDSPVFEGMSDEAKAETIHEVWQRAQNRKEEEANLEAQKIAEGRDAAEGAEEGPVENEDGTTEANPVARDERGRLYTSDDVSTDDAGNVTGGTFVVGDKTKSENNRYGYIKYSQDAEGNITIQDFKMTNGREGLRAEAFDEFAREHPDVNIEWNPKAGEWEDAKQELIDANPSGKKNGLNYYSTADLDNIQARKRVAEELRKNIHNVKRNADGSYTQTELSNKQIAAGITLIESAARRMNMGLNEYINKTFGSQIFGSREEFAEASLAQGEDVNKKAGGMYQGVAQSNWREVGQQIKAVIYAGEHADFSTWAHEMAHVFQNQLDGQLKTDAEAAFNVQNGDWINSTYTFKDGRTMSSAEAFAYGFQDWLETGKAENEQMRNIFQKFAEFIADCYNRLKNHLDFTPEIESVFNQLLDGDDTIMSKALKAAQEQDNEYRASLKRQAEEKQAAKEAEKEEAKKQAEAAREEASEGTDFENTQEEQSTEEIESKLDEVTNETEKTDNAIDNALENTNLTDEKKAEIADVLKDETTTRVEKSEAVTEAASSVYNDESEIDGYPDLMFQLAGEPSIRRMAESEERERILTELDAAQLLDEKYKNMDANSRAARIRRATGWEKDAKGEWKYEFDDSVNRIKTEFFKANPGVLSGIPYLLNLGDILEAEELYKVFPYMKNVRVGFYSDPNAFRAVLTPQGIKVNTRYLQGMNGETGLKGVLAHEIQHIIQAMEFADSKGLQGADIEQLYNDVMKAMQAAGERKYNYDLTSLQQGLDAYMKDAGEIEARNVARRIMMNADQRRMNTLASTEDVKRGGLLFQDESDVVRAQFENTNKWLKAPNGEDSNLNEKQWLQVRTPSFKKWFGDWEKDPANASKVVDENGEPLVVYHGTDADFTVFDASKSRANMDIQGNFFSPWDIDAQGYGPNVRAFYLNIKNPANSSQGYSALNTYKGQNEAGIKARELLKSKGYDGVNNDNEEYITFEPNQIKSATDNNGNFDANNPDILFQIAGEIGAENLDNSEVQEGVSRMQNLAIAKQMETEKKDAQAIRFATGWEKGADGKWKYEIDDSKIKTDFEDKSYLFRIRNPRYGELEEKLRSLNYDWEKLSKEEQEEFDKLGDLYNENLERNEVVLMEILDAPELFRAYPQLREMPVTFKTRDYSQNYEAHLVNGYYVDDNSPYFAIEFNGTPNSYNSEKFKSTLLHEIQHAIQRIEGFGRGGNLEEAAELIEKGNQKKAEIKSKAFAWEWKIELEKQEEKYPELKGNLALMNSLIDEYTENGKYPIKELEDEHWLPERDIRDKGFNLYVRGYDKEGFEEAYKEWQEKAGKKGVTVFNPTKDTERNRFNYYKRFAGEVESRNVQTRMNFTPEQRLNTLLAATEDVEPEDKIILFQTVYHGSSANFEEFDTDSYGLSGEGSMSFGYGAYVTDSKDIALNYAERQGNPIQYRIKALTEIIKEEEEILKENISERLRYVKEKDLAKYKEELEKLKEQEPTEEEIRGKRALYTVEIPNDGFIKWDENINPQIVEGIIKEHGYFYGLKNLLDNYNKWKDNPNATYLYGSNVYKAISRELGSDKAASHFLQNLGFKGIDYPAGTVYGNGDGSRNYVVFNDDDAKIVDKLLFQTNAELMDEAKTFDSWQEFMDYCQLSDDEQNAFENDEAWYKSFWEQANAITKEQEKKAEAEERRQQAEADTPEMVDRLFISYIKNNPETVDNFVQAVSDIMEMDLGGDEWAQVDEEGGRERERYAVLQDYISAELSDGNWQTAIAKVQGGHEISDYIRKRLITEMTDSYKARDFRNLYAAVMKENRFTVDALDTRADELLRKLEKYPKRYYDIVAPTEDVTVTTPQRRKEIAQEMQNRDMAARIKAGSLKVDDEVINYLKSVEKKEKDLKKQEQQLTDKIQGLYNDVGNTGLQMLINTHEKLMEQKARLNNRNADTQRKIEKGLRMTDRYTRQTQDMTQTYHELERKFSDLKDSMVITNEVQQILDAQEQRREIREEVARLTKERYLADETKKIRVNLVKQLFRKVDLAKVDFKQAQLIIAIQKLTLPNMIGGVNRWIGRNSPFLNAVLSRIVTDSEYKNRIVNYLEHVEKQTDTFRDFVESIRNAKSREDFENWGVAEREYAIKYLPKENWVWELKLKEKARDLQESLHLDITQEKVERQVYDADGHPVEDDEGKPVMETAYQFKIGDEALNKLLQETLGDELFSRLMNSPMVEWSTQEMEELVARVNQIRDEGITMRAAKLEARKREAQKFMQQVADAVKDTGIVINEDDTPEEKEKKLEKINKILGKNKDLKGTEASKDTGFMAKLNRILHGYKDANVLRVARILDNQKEGVNTYLLYRREDDYYNKKMRSIMSRGETVHKVMAANKINEGELAKSIEIEGLGTKFTVDELLFFLAADKDFQLDENGNNDNYAATSRNAVCFGNMMSDTASQELKEGWAKLDAEMKEAIEKDHLTPEQRQLLSDKQLDTKPGTTAYIRECNRRWEIVLRAANELLNENPEYNALLEAIQADYAEQYERMNEVSISEFNIGVNRVKCYVPLVRRESNGDTNENKVMEDLLAINGVGKSGVNKGMTQSRTSISPLHQRPVQTGLFRTWCDSVDRTEHFIAYAPYVRLLNRVYNSRDAQYLRSTIEGRYGKGMLDYIDAYISEVANPNAGNTRSTGAELLHILRGKTAPAYLGWKASAIIKQGLTSPWPYMQFVNPAEYLAALFKCNNPKMWEAIQEKSVFMKNRRMDPINDLVDEMAKNAKNKVDKFWSSFTKTGMQGLEWIDWVCVAPGWYACYEKKYNQLQKASEARYNAKMAELEERNKSGNGEVLNPTQMETIARQEILEDIEVEAVTYADDCTRQCQPSNRITDLAPLFKEKNEFMRAFMQFQTSLNVIWQNIRYDLPYAVKQKEFGRIVGTVLGYTMAGIFMNSVMDGITSGADGDDDKDKQALRNLVFYATTQFTDAIPMLGSDFTNIMDQVITGKRGFMNSGTDMTPTASKLFSAFTTASKGNWQKAAELTAEGIGLYLGAPVSGAKEINKLLGKPLKNGEVDIKAGISDVYGIAGDILEE